MLQTAHKPSVKIFAVCQGRRTKILHTKCETGVKYRYLQNAAHHSFKPGWRKRDKKRVAAQGHVLTALCYIPTPVSLSKQLKADLISIWDHL